MTMPSTKRAPRTHPTVGRGAVLVIALGVVFTLVALLLLLSSSSGLIPAPSGAEASGPWSVSTPLVFAGWAVTTVVSIAVALVRATRRIES